MTPGEQTCSRIILPASWVIDKTFSHHPILCQYFYQTYKIVFEPLGAYLESWENLRDELLFDGNVFTAIHHPQARNSFIAVYVTEVGLVYERVLSLSTQVPSCLQTDQIFAHWGRSRCFQHAWTLMTFIQMISCDNNNIRCDNNNHNILIRRVAE